MCDEVAYPEVQHQFPASSYGFECLPSNDESSFVLYDSDGDIWASHIPPQYAEAIVEGMNMLISAKRSNTRQSPPPLD